MPQLFIDRISPALQVNRSLPASNPFRVPLLPSGGDILDVSRYRTLHIRIAPSSVQTVDLIMGKISGNTLASHLQFRPDDQIHRVPLAGPEILLSLLKPPGATGTEKIQLWVYLTD